MALDYMVFGTDPMQRTDGYQGDAEVLLVTL